MTHKEFKLIVKQDIFESGWPGVNPVKHKVGDVLIVNEHTFLELQANQVITWSTREGSISFDKYNFENEVAVTEITIEYSVRKLGQRNAKKV
jgi:hypothetical protein